MKPLLDFYEVICYRNSKGYWLGICDKLAKKATKTPEYYDIGLFADPEHSQAYIEHLEIKKSQLQQEIIDIEEQIRKTIQLIKEI